MQAPQNDQSFYSLADSTMTIGSFLDVDSFECFTLDVRHGQRALKLLKLSALLLNYVQTNVKKILNHRKIILYSRDYYVLYTIAQASQQL